MLLVFTIQHRGILGTANVQKYIALVVIIPMLIVGVVPIITGRSTGPTTRPSFRWRRPMRRRPEPGMSVGGR